MAVNDKDPTEAILLVEQTIGTFNQIVVGNEGQMVPVPGYPDQPTLAERVKQNLKPSTDAAASYANQAAASAKAADDAAKSASQISGLDNVVDAIGLAATPLPDVWAPLSDSLRLITGYGREVKVGSDVVARYVSFERLGNATYFDKSDVLITALANEPRFVREGLLIEGPSTNILKWDSTRAPSGGGVQSPVTSPSYPGITAKKVVGGTSSIAIGASKEILKDSTVYSATAIIDLKNSNIPNNKVQLQFAYSANWNSNLIKVDISTLSVTATAGTTGTAKIIGDLLVITATTTSSASASASVGGSVDLYYLDASGLPSPPPSDGSICVVGFQMEEGEPSSFILTSNSAATRATEKVYIDSSLNFSGSFTLVADVSLNWNSLPNVAPRIFDTQIQVSNSLSYRSMSVDDSAIKAQFGVTGGFSRSTTRNGRKFIAAMRFNSDTGMGAVFATGETTGDGTGGSVSISDKVIAVRIGGQGDSGGARNLFGAIRNLRIWHKALSDAQVKAIR